LKVEFLVATNSYLVFSFRGQDYLSVPTVPPRLRRLGVEFYKEISARRWLFKLGVRLAIIARIDRLVARQLSTPVPKHPNFSFDAWLAEARQGIGSTDAQAVVSFPGQPNRRRFYVNLVSPKAEALAFAKISLDEKNDQHLETEAKTLRYLAAQDIRSFRVPKVLVEGTFNSHRYLITAPMPAKAKPAPATWEPIAKRCRDELAGVSRRQQRLEELSWWGSFNDKAQEVKPLAEAIKAEEDRIVEVCRVHGDYTSRNISCVGDEVWLFDWENSAPDAPVMTDEVRFFLGIQGRRIDSNPADVAAALGHRYLASRSRAAQRELALALAFLSTRTKSGVICGQYWHHIASHTKT
jgi:hypothetical protein